MPFRTVVVPFLGGGALLLGYAAFSWLRTRRAALSGPITLREAGLLDAPDTGERSDAGDPSGTFHAHDIQHQMSVADEQEPSARFAGVPEVLELDLDFDDELPPDYASVHDSVAPEDIGALFLARATDALSPFSEHFAVDHLDLDPLDLDTSLLSEATARAAIGEQGLDSREEPEAEEPELVTESERRPANASRAGGTRP